MNTAQLETFVHVVEAGSFNKDSKYIIEYMRETAICTEKI